MTTTLDPETITETPRHTAGVDAAALIQLLKAVLPHTDGTEEIYQVHRVRLIIGTDRIEAHATDRRTAVIARITNEAALDLDDPGWTVDLYPADLAQVAKMFKPGKDEEIRLRLDLRRDDRVTVTDVSGLFEGRAYTIPSVGHPEDFPDLHKLIAGTMRADRSVVSTVTYTGDLLRRFAASAAAYNDALHVDPTAEGRPFVVTVAENFIGLLMPRSNNDEVTSEQARVRSDWFTSLDT